MAHAGGKKGYQLKRRPKEYRPTPQQIKFAEAVEFCGIRKGISKSELQKKMVECIPQFYKEAEENDHQSLPLKAL